VGNFASHAEGRKKLWYLNDSIDKGFDHVAQE